MKCVDNYNSDVNLDAKGVWGQKSGEKTLNIKLSIDTNERAIFLSN